MYIIQGATHISRKLGPGHWCSVRIPPKRCGQAPIKLNFSRPRHFALFGYYLCRATHVVLFDIFNPFTVTAVSCISYISIYMCECL